MGSVMCEGSGRVDVFWSRDVGEAGRVLQCGITWLPFVIDVSEGRRLKERRRQRRQRRQRGRCPVLVEAKHSSRLYCFQTAKYKARVYYLQVTSYKVRVLHKSDRSTATSASPCYLCCPSSTSQTRPLILLAAQCSRGGATADAPLPAHPCHRRPRRTPPGSKHPPRTRHAPRPVPFFFFVSPSPDPSD